MLEYLGLLLHFRTAPFFDEIVKSRKIDLSVIPAKEALSQFVIPAFVIPAKARGAGREPGSRKI